MKFRTIFILVFVFITNTFYAQTAGSNGCDRTILFSKPGDFDYSVPTYGWHLDFEDNFNSNTLDVNNWENKYSWCARSLGTSEQQYYSDNQNIVISNGSLKITAKLQSVYERLNPCYSPNQIMDDGVQNLRNFNFTSGLISSKRNFGYGKYEIRCKIPYSSGAWPAFWTFGGTPTGGSSEIDCFEFYGGDFNRQGTNLHSDNNTSCGYDSFETGLTTSFHTYSVVYMPSYIEWYRDDNLIRRVNKYHHLTISEAQDPSLIYQFTGQFDPVNWAVDYNNMYELKSAFPEDGSLMKIIANLAVENTAWPLTFPSTFEIDYIKHYSNTPCGSQPYYLTGQQLNIGLNSTAASNMLFSFNQNDLNVFNLNVNNGQNLQLRACNTIAITSEFNSVQGSDLLIKADLEYCCTPTAGYRIASNNTDVNNYDTSHSNIDNSKTKKNSYRKNTPNNQYNVNSNGINISVFPNPNTGDFSVETYNISTKKIKVINNLGITIYENEFNESSHKLSLNIANGLYYLEILEGTKKTNQIIVIEK